MYNLHLLGFYSFVNGYKTELVVKMYFLHLVLVLIVYNGQIVDGGNVNLLKVTNGSGVSFIDLWNLKGKTVGKEADAVYRNGLIDRPVSTGCPSRIYFQLKGSDGEPFSINFYNSPHISANLSAWMEKTPPHHVQHGIEKNTITLKLRPQNGVDFWLKNSGTGKYYVTILFDRTNGTGPTLYVCCDSATKDNGGYTNPFSGTFQADHLLVKGKYAGSCDTSAPTDVAITADQVKNELYPSPGPVISTYPPQVTTADESSTESAEMSTVMTDTSSTEKIEASTSAAEQSTNERTEVSTPKTNTSPAKLTEVSTLAADESPTEKTGVSTPATDTPSSDTTTSQVSQSPIKGTTDETVKMCPCSCEYKARLDMLNTRSNKSLEELRKEMQPELDEIKRRYTWNKTKTSAFKRKKISAADKRKSSEQIGIVAGSFIAVVIGLVILIDVVAIKRHVGVFRRHFWGEETRPDEEAELVDTRKKKSKMKKEKKQKSKQ